MSSKTRQFGTWIAALSACASALLSQEAPRPANWPAPPFWHATVISREIAVSEVGAAFRDERTEAPTSPLPFVAIDPCRMLDTRVTGGPIASGFTRDVVLTGAPCGIPANAAAVSANFVIFNIIGAPSNGVLKVWPTGSPATFQALLNWSPTAGQLDNASVVSLGPGGSITLSPNQGAGTIDMVVDVNGYYAGTVVTSVAPGTGLSGGGSGAVTVGIAAGGVTATELASNAVTSAKIAANAVTAGAIAAGAVGSAKIADGAVTDAEVSGPITFAKIGNAFPGGIFFGGPTGILSQDAPGLFWDPTNHRLGLGTATPGQQLEVTGMMSMPATLASSGSPTAGVLFLGSDPFLHNYSPPGSCSYCVNMFLGSGAGNFTMTGYYDTAIGYRALTLNTSGFSNTAVGHSSLLVNTQGSGNTAVGTASLFYNSTASDNVAVGSAALFTQSFSNSDVEWSSGNTAVGSSALYFNQPTSNQTGLANTAVGAYSLYTNTTGAFDTALGASALYSSTTGYRNTAVGFNAGNRAGASTGYGGGAITYVPITTGNYNTFIGHGTGATAGDVFNCTAVGIDAYCDAPNEVRLGNIFVTSIGGKVGWSALSDARAKSDIEDLSLGLDFVRKLRPVAYKVKGGNGRTDMGFVAQDVEKVLGDGYNVLTVAGDSDRTLSLRYTDLIAPLVKAVQEQQALIERQRTLIEEQQRTLRDLTTRLSRLEPRDDIPAPSASTRPPS